MSRSIWTLFWSRKMKKDVPFATNLPPRFRTRLQRQSWPAKKRWGKLWRQVIPMFPSLQANIQSRLKNHSSQPSYRSQKLTQKPRKKVVPPQLRRMISKLHRLLRAQTQTCQSTQRPCLPCLCSSETILTTTSSQCWSSCGKIFRRSIATRWRWSLGTFVFSERNSLRTRLLCNASS